MSVINSSKASLTFQWTPTSSGDEVYDYQTFVIQYKICTTVDWLSKNFVVTGATNDPQTANISDLTAGSLYDVRMTARNTIGSSSYTDIIVVSTLSENNAEAAGQNTDEECITILIALLVTSLVINGIFGFIMLYTFVFKRSK
ncbi:Hypothetical predicted protein [Mytilus galloprovincialis]|uniref:Fibronectin type-III domain-containing protein n=2 Tax=Mytilus galloprovincialis TaxID=29158 RepID=A0A8B6GLB8_MYTGA|nr:Hypothetical predicted protein [Mytilus galloprovincialis]